MVTTNLATNLVGNRIVCGHCKTEFDLNLNEGCPLCGFGGKGKLAYRDSPKVPLLLAGNYLDIPKGISAKPGITSVTKISKHIGSWGMCNSWFPIKACLRVVANTMYRSKKEYIPLGDLIANSRESFKVRELSKFRGFPNDTESDSSISRLVNHFISTATDMGLFDIRTTTGSKVNVWNEQWSEIEITVTRDGYEFARLRNNLLDDQNSIQVLTAEESKWILGYLRSIDAEYKEYSILQAVYKFIKSGHNGKDELWQWFKQNPTFVTSVKEWSRKVNDSKDFNRQLDNLAPMFSSAKVAMLRELGVIKNRRNDYTIVGNLE